MNHDETVQESDAQTQNANVPYLLGSALLISVGLALPRFLPGLPMGVDSSSHLYRVLFLERWAKQGIIPFWSPDWYGGSPVFLLYPPLSYWLAAGTALIGVDPITAYKAFDAAFYVIAPATVYFLGKELGFSPGESAIGALFFSVTPQIIQNYLVFDRFPTIVAVPIFCSFLIALYRALDCKNLSMGYTFASVIAFSALLLTHHLSALIASFVGVLMVLLAAARRGWRTPILTLTVIGAGTFGLTAFWFMPFITWIRLFSVNPFYNRSVSFPFLRFTYFAGDVVASLVGIVQFVLAAFAIQRLNRGFSTLMAMSPVAFFVSLLTGMVLFQIGEITQFASMLVGGQVVVILSFAIFLGQIICSSSLRERLVAGRGVFVAVVWFFLFLWLGLGYFVLPVLWVPPIGEFWIKAMDPSRIWLYLSIPLCLLAGWYLNFLIFKLRERFRRLEPRALSLVTAGLLILILVPTTLMTVSGLQVLDASVSNVPPYTVKNAEIPESIIDYFNNDNSSGRILGINVPLWIYILPNFVDKSIVDGWYPQEKLLTPLVSMNDYRLDDLPAAPNSQARINTWKTIIQEADLLDITWILIGGHSLAHLLMGANNDFVQQKIFPYGALDLIVFKARRIPLYVEPSTSVSKISQPSPDQILISFDPPLEKGEKLIIKEAYFPTLTSISDHRPLVVERDGPSGYIVLIVPAGTHQVLLHYAKDTVAWNLISAVSTIVSIGLGLILLRSCVSKRSIHIVV